MSRTFPLWRIIAIWLLLAVFLATAQRETIVTMFLADPDDTLRLVQVRELLAGQGWFDLVQHRIHPPEGLAMHWSRLVDVPLAFGIAGLSPLVGSPWAERISVTLAPLFSLLLLMIAALVQVRRLHGPNRELILIAPLLLVSAPCVYMQFLPARIDHHGWQMVAAAFAIAALLDRKPVRSGAGAGMALAAYLAISIEGLPFVAATTAAAGILWALGMDRSARFAMLAASLAAASIALWLTTSGAPWSTRYCDIVAPGHLAALTAFALVMFTVTRLKDPSRRAAAGVLAIGGAAALGSLALVAPQCLASPFGTMDPLVYRYWYLSLMEGLPVWYQSPQIAADLLVFCPLGMAGCAMAAWEARGRASRYRWLLLTLISLASFATALIVYRTAGVAHVAAMPGVFALFVRLRTLLTGRVKPAIRPLAAVSALLVLLPPLPTAATQIAADQLRGEGKHPSPVTAADVSQLTHGLREMAAMPRMTLLAAFDIAPLVIANTPHDVFAAGYHRLQKPMRTALDIFMAPPDAAEPRMRATGLHHLLIMLRGSELAMMRKAAPGGLMAQLADGNVPPWLEPVDLHSSELKLYRLREQP